MCLVGLDNVMLVCFLKLWVMPTPFSAISTRPFIVSLVPGDVAFWASRPEHEVPVVDRWEMLSQWICPHWLAGMLSYRIWHLNIVSRKRLLLATTKQYMLMRFVSQSRAPTRRSTWILGSKRARASMFSTLPSRV